MTTRPHLLCRIGPRVCALPLESLREIMRPLPVEVLGAGPSFVRGVAVIRGEPTPVMDVGALLGGAPSASPSAEARFVTLKLASRSVALLVDAVLGMQALDPSDFAEVPPLLRSSTAEVVAALGRLDRELCVLLESARIVSRAAGVGAERAAP